MIAIKSFNVFSVSGPATIFRPLLKRPDHQGKNGSTTRGRHCNRLCALPKGSMAMSSSKYVLKKGKYPSILGNFDLTLIPQGPKPHHSSLSEGHPPWKKH